MQSCANSQCAIAAARKKSRKVLKVEGFRQISKTIILVNCRANREFVDKVDDGSLALTSQPNSLNFDLLKFAVDLTDQAPNFILNQCDWI